MALVVCNAGEIKMLTWIVTHGNLTLKLYSNDYTPLPTSTAASFTECSWTGYSAQTIATTDWGTPTTNGDGKAEVTATDLEWTCTDAGGTIYGYFVLSGSDLIYAERFATARTVSENVVLSLPPKLTLASE